MNSDQLVKIRKDIDDYDAANSVALEEIKFLSKKLMDVTAKIEESWSGSFAGWHGRMYFHDFQKPSLYERFSGEWGAIRGMPDGWEEKDNAEVVERISQMMGGDSSVEKFEERVDSIRTAITDLADEVNSGMALLDAKTLVRERPVIEEIEKFSLDKSKIDYIKNRQPTSLMTRDMEALRQGILLPSWLYYAAVGYEGIKTVESFISYKKLVNRFLRQAVTRISTLSTAIPPIDVAIHPDIQAKCISLYDSGAYSEAVERGFKVVRDKLRSLTGHETGSEAFGKGKLHIKGAAASNVDGDFNQGAKFLMMAIDMFRNEKSHTSDAQMDDPVRAYQYLVMSSLALRLLDNSEINP